METRASGVKAPWIVLILGTFFTLLTWLSTVNYLERPSLRALQSEAEAAFYAMLPWLVLLAGLLVTGIVTFTLHRFMTSRDRALAHAEEIARSLSESEGRLELALAGADLGLWDWDLRTGRLVRNQRWARIFGFRPEDITPDFAAWERMVHPDDRAMVQERLDDHLAGHAEIYEAEYRLRNSLGGWIWVLDRGRIAERDAAGKAVRISGTLLDVTDRRRRVEQLRLSEERLGLALEGSGISLWDANGETGDIFLSDGWSVLLGGPARPTSTTTPKLLELIHPDDLEKARSTVTEVLKGHYAAYEEEHRVRTRSGEWKWVLSRGKVVSRGADGRAKRLIGTNMDITERKRAEEQIEHMAYHDALTGLPNRLLLEDRVRRDIALAHRGRGRAAVLFLDLDHFKHINDSEGHAAGDRVLQRVADRVIACLRDGDTVARVGGDEFAICLPSIEHANDAAIVARKILDSLAHPVVDEGHETQTNASIGISLFPEDGPDPTTLLRNADNAMYHAKELGRGQFQFFREEMNQRVQHRLNIERGLRLALDRGEFVLHYQPQVEVATGRIAGVEALVRWAHQEGGLVAPTEFIAIAEETGQIVALGEWALREACLQGARWDADGIPPVTIGVNLSVRQFREKGLVDRVREALAESAFPPARLELEITEGILLQHGEETLALLEALGFIVGARLTVDDFGTGYSGLGYLRRLPIHGLKIDRSFVREIDRSREDEAIVAGVIEIAKGLRISVTAEGVETAAQLRCLQRLGCQRAQGFLLGPPLPAREIQPLLRSGIVRPAIPSNPMGTDVLSGKRSAQQAD